MPRTCSRLAEGKNEESEHDRLCSGEKLGKKNESGTCSVEREGISPRKENVKNLYKFISLDKMK